MKLQRDIPRGQIPRRRVSCVTKEPIPTEKLDVLEQNFRRHHYVSPEVSPSPPLGEGTHTTPVPLADGMWLRPIQLRATLAIELDLPPQKVRAPLAQRLVASPFHSSYLSNICTMLSSSIA